MSKNAIHIKGLNKTYAASGKAPEKVALKDVDLEIKKGLIFGLLGPNGAGKSTIINILAGLVVKTSGTVEVCGYDIEGHEKAVKSCLGIVPQEINYDPFFSPVKLLELQAGLYGVPKSKRRSMGILKMMGLEDKAHSYVRSLSGGMRRRLMVAKAMVHSPPILILDEPTAGVDVELRKQLWKNVRALNEQGTTIVLTTHYLEEAEELCDEIAIINHGEIICSEPKEDLLARIENKEVIFRLDRQVQTIPAELEAFNAKKIGGRSIGVSYSPQEYSIGAMIEIIQKGGYGIADISTSESDLEDIFIRLTS